MYKCENLKQVYELVGKDLLYNGDISSPRGLETKELINVSFMINNPRDRLVYNKSRKFSLIYAIVESLMLVQNTNDLKYYSKFNNNIAQFSDDDVTLYGAYGTRINNNLDYIVAKLKSQPDSRQCFLPIINANDMQHKTKDLPCTLGLHFMVRHNALDLIAYMRSNDIMWGTAYDIFMFTMLQEIIANTLEINVGKYYHNASSLHVYKKHYDSLNDISADSEAHIVANKYCLNDWKKIGEWYMGIVNKNFTKDKDCDIINIDNVFIKLLMNEFNFVEDANARIAYDIAEEWARPFTKRWYKNG